MERVNIRSLDFTNDSWLQDRIFREQGPCSVQTTESVENEEESSRNLFTGNSGDDPERGSKESELHSRTIPVNNFRGTKGFRGFPSSIQSENSEQIYCHNPFQNGIHSACKESCPETRFHDHNRSQGCLFFDSDSHAGSKVSQIRMGRRSPGIPGDAFWPDNGTQGLYKGYEADRISSTSDGNASSHLFRRPDSVCRIRRRMLESGQIHSEPFSTSRHGCELEKVSIDPNTEYHVFRPYPGYTGDDAVIAKQKSGRSHKHVQKDVAKRPSFSKRACMCVGQDVCNCRRCGSGTSVSPRLTTRSYKSDSQRSIIPHSNPAIRKQPPGVTMVGNMSPAVEWETNDSPPSRIYNNIRCLDQRVGSSLSRATDRREVDKSRTRGSYKLSRASSLFSRPADVRQRGSPLPCHAKARQYDSFGLHKTQRRDAHDQSVQFSSANVEMVPRAVYNVDSLPCPRRSERNCGLSVESVQRSSRMVSRPPPLPGGVQRDGFHSDHRSLCVQDKPSLSEVCRMEARSRGGGSELILSEVDERTRMGISALLSLASGVAEDPYRGGDSIGGRSNMANTKLVSNVSTVSYSATHTASSERLGSHTATLRPITSVNPVTAPSGVETLRQRFVAKGLSEDVAKVMLASCRDSTHKQYESSWKAWASWCDKKSIDPISAPVNMILEFLVECEAKGLAYRSLGVYRSAISHYHEPVVGRPVGEYPEISRLMKGFFNRNPPRPKYTITWEVEPVLVFLRDMAPWSELSLKLMTIKLVLILALVSAGRVSSLVHIDISKLSVSKSVLRFAPSQLLKQTRPNYPLKCVEIEAFQDSRLCPVKAVSAYLAKTKQCRGTESQLLISYVKPFKRVVSSTVSRWIVSGLKMAGIDTEKFGAHSTRGAATSASKKLGVAMRDILATAGWSSDSTFSKFYHRPSANSCMAKALLSVASKSHID